MTASGPDPASEPALPPVPDPVPDPVTGDFRATIGQTPAAYAYAGARPPA